MLLVIKFFCRKYLLLTHLVFAMSKYAESGLLGKSEFINSDNFNRVLTTCVGGVLGNYPAQ